MLLIMLCLVTSLNAETELKTHWDLVKSKCDVYGLDPQLEFITDGVWTFKGNEDYEKFIDVMMTTLQTSDLPKEPEWYEKKEMLILLGFVGGFLTAK